MKKIFITILTLLTLLPFGVNAKKNIIAEDLQYSCKKEGITFDSKNPIYKLPVYIFRGQNSDHSKELLTFLESIYDDYYDKFDFLIYEVWNNEDNKKLMEKVAEVMEDDVSGVPYLVIGNYTFKGYDSSMNDKIISALNSSLEEDDFFSVLQYIGTKGYFDEPNYIGIIILSNIIILLAIIIITKKLYDKNIYKEKNQ